MKIQIVEEGNVPEGQEGAVLTVPGRTRMNVMLTAKGKAQFDVTAEYSTPEEAQEQLGKAIDGVRATIAAKGLVLVDGT